MTTTHRHRPVVHRTHGYRGCVAPDACHSAAHGGVLFYDVCACGATRRINSTGRHSETTGWVAPAEADVIEAGRIARRLLQDGQTAREWRRAGYRSALEAALVLVGDSGSEPVQQIAARLIVRGWA